MTNESDARTRASTGAASSISPVPSPRRARTRAADGYELRYRVWDPPGATRGHIILLNGIMSNSAWFSPICAPLVASGMQLVGADRRGSGDNDLGRGDAPSARILVDDVVRIIDDEVPTDAPILMVGWCWGAALAIVATLELPRVGGLVLVTPGLFPSQKVKDAVAREQDRIDRTPPDQPSIPSPVREADFTDGPALDAFIRADARRVTTVTPRLLEISSRMGTGAIIRLRRITVPITVVLADDDDATDNEATRVAFDRLGSGRVIQRMIPGRHGVQFDAPQALAAMILEAADRVWTPGAPA